MPVIRITSLPPDDSLEIPTVLADLSQALAETFDIDIRHIAITWQLLPAGHYADGGITTDRQPESTHPLRVDVLIPDFNPPENIEKILLLLGEELANSVKVAQENIFIHLRTAQSGTIYDGGAIVEWPAAREDKQMTDRTERSGQERRTDDDRRQANDPNSSPEERRSGTERRSGEDRRNNSK